LEGPVASLRCDLSLQRETLLAEAS